MEALHPRCAGLDVHEDGAVAAVRPAEAGVAHTEARRFDTTAPGLPAPAAWSAECGCARAAMEATGAYRKPVRHVPSDGGPALIPADAAHVRNVPGRKTDIADATRPAEPLAHGLIRPSFAPEPATRATRALPRARERPAREQASRVRRPRKTPEDADLKPASVPTDIMGLSGRGPGQCPEPWRRWSRASAAPSDRSPRCTPGSRPSRRGCARR